MRTLILLLTLIVGAIVGKEYYDSLHPQKIEFVTSVATRQDVTESVAVTGAAEEMSYTVVQSEIPGTISEVLVDFNDEVIDDQPLARLRSEVQKLQLTAAKSGLVQANAAVKMAEAGAAAAAAAVEVAETSSAAAKAELEKVEGLASATDAATAEINVRRLQLVVKKAEAAVAVAKAQLKQAEAGVDVAKTKVTDANDAIALANLQLDKTVLKSNKTGTVLDMDIHVGDTVGRPKLRIGRDSPSGLFKIAAPLDKMLAIVRVNESDYSRVKVGQHAEFTIDTYPDTVFEAVVTQIRNTPTKDPTAVSYNTVLEFDNRPDPDGQGWMIRPRATVSADIRIRQVKGALVVPNEALMFSPANFDDLELPRTEKGQRLVWSVGPDSAPLAHIIKPGITDGIVTQVVDGDVTEGMELITREPVASESKELRLPLGN